ncbi:unnamed protein product, partial [Amoebophrya sp. A25]
HDKQTKETTSLVQRTKDESHQQLQQQEQQQNSLHGSSWPNMSPCSSTPMPATASPIPATPFPDWAASMSPMQMHSTAWVPVPNQQSILGTAGFQVPVAVVTNNVEQTGHNVAWWPGAGGG